MNNSTTAVRRAFAAAAVVIGFSGLTACGTEIAPPSQDIGTVVEKQQKAPVQPRRTTGNRMHFGDDLGDAKTRAPRQATPAGSGTRNRMDFRDTGR